MIERRGRFGVLFLFSSSCLCGRRGRSRSLRLSSRGGACRLMYEGDDLRGDEGLSLRGDTGLSLRVFLSADPARSAGR